MLLLVRSGTVVVAKGNILKCDAQRAGGQPGPRALDHLGLGTEQGLYALDVGPGPLQVAHLALDAVQRRAQQADVMDDQVDGADGHRSVQQKGGADGQGGHPGQEVSGHAGVIAQALHQLGPAPGVEHGAHQAVELRHHVGLGPVGADVLGRRKPFPQKTEQLGVRLARVAPSLGGRFLSSAQGGDGQQGISRAHQADAPVLAEKQEQDARRQQAVAQQVDRHL